MGSYNFLGRQKWASSLQALMTGSLFLLHFSGVKQPTAHQVIKKTAPILASLAPFFIKLPARHEMRILADQLEERFKIPNIPMGTDGTFIRLGKKTSKKFLPRGNHAT